MSSKNFKFHGTNVQVLAGFGSTSPPKAISGITRAAPAVVTATAHGLDSGDVIQPTGIGGMVDLNGGTFIVEVLTANTFALVGVDSTGYPAYTSGGVLAVGEFSPNFCELTNWNRSGAAAPTIDTTSMCSTFQENEIGLPGFGTLELGYKFDQGSSTQKIIRALEASGAITAVRRTLPKNGGETTVLGYVTTTTDQAGVGTIWTGTASLQLTGAPYDVEIEA